MGLAVGVSAQTSLDSLMMRRVAPCFDIQMNGRELLAGSIEHGSFDSARIVLDYWKERCALDGAARLASLLLDIQQGRLTDSSYTDHLLSTLATYRSWRDPEKVSRPMRNWWVGYYVPEDDTQREPDRLERGMRNWADSLASVLPQYTYEHDIAEFIGPQPDSLFPRLGRGVHSGTKLNGSYTREITAISDMTEGHWAFFLGGWVPLGELQVLGIHPEFGFRLGAKRKRMNYDMTIAFKAGSAEHPYVAKHIKAQGQADTTNHFFGGHIGVDVGWDLLCERRSEVQLTGGLAWDGFDAFKNDEDNKDMDASASSFDLSGGVAYRWYTNGSTYLGLEVKFHWVDYTRNGVVALTGQPITVRFIVGSANNVYRRMRAEAVQFRYRR